MDVTCHLRPKKIIESTSRLRRTLFIFLVKANWRLIMSRPKKEVTRSEVVKFKLTKAEKEVLKKKASLSGISVSELIRRKLNV